MISCLKGSFRVSSPYGWRIINGKKEFHKGIDLVATVDRNVYSICDGIAFTKYEKNGFGKYIEVRLENGLSIMYGHLDGFHIVNNTRVKAGDKIGIMGNTGNSTGYHTHLEIRVTGTKTPLDITYFTGIPNAIGVYADGNPVFTSYESACNVERICGLDKNTISYMWKYPYSDELFRKINLKLLF